MSLLHRWNFLIIDRYGCIPLTGEGTRLFPTTSVFESDTIVSEFCWEKYQEILIFV